MKSFYNYFCHIYNISYVIKFKTSKLLWLVFIRLYIFGTVYVAIDVKVKHIASV